MMKTAYTYNKKKQVEKASGDAAAVRYAYDKAGNIVKASMGKAGMLARSYKYDENGNVTEATADRSGDKTKTVYKYKKLSIDERYEDAVKKQQWTLLNEEDLMHVFH